MNKKGQQLCLFWGMAFLLLALPFSIVGAQGAESPNNAGVASTLLYYSDYFSFIGEDEKGRVAFALDNNRGRDGDSWQAEHFVVLHAEQEGRQGWTTVAGNGSYKNQKHELQTIPDSAFFQFEGKPSEGITIHSPKNRLSLKLEPIPFRLKRTHKGGQFLMGSAPGVLEWKGRTLKGRVIYEYLHMPDFNRLTRKYPGMWKDFHGLYAWVEGGGDLYIHHQQGELFKPLVGELVGFAFLDGKDVALEDLRVEVLETQQAKGTYRWPIHWQGGWTINTKPATFDLKLSELNAISNWVVGGFSMGIITGELSAGERKLFLYGLGELLI